MDHGAHNATLCLDNPFWRYSLKQYAVPGCSEFLLAAQDDHGLDINVLLFLGWLADTGMIFSPALLEEPMAFTAQVIEPLRLSRRTMKTQGNDALYQHIKASELLAEQHIQALLYDKSRALETLEPDATSFKQSLNGSLNEYLPSTLKHNQDWKALLMRYLSPRMG